MTPFQMSSKQSIQDLHVFIESWLKGTLQNTRDEFRYFEESLDENFIIIHPDGKQQNKREICNGLWDIYGVQSDQFFIRINDIEFRQESDRLCIMTYKEQQAGDVESTRKSTVIFNKSELNDNILWFHLHETWLHNPEISGL